MNQQRWSAELFLLYKNCRNLPHWERLKSMHDIEDQAYFEMLDSYDLEKLNGEK